MKVFSGGVGVGVGVDLLKEWTILEMLKTIQGDCRVSRSVERNGKAVCLERGLVV